MGKKKGQRNPLNGFKLSHDEVKALEGRVRSNTLSTSDQQLIISLMTTVIELRAMVLRGKAGMLSLLRKLFGAKTEKQKNQKKKTDEDTSTKSGSGGGNPKGKGHGRNGAKDFPGAQRVSCKHDELKAGDICPECGSGILKEEEPALHQFWSGQPPLQLVIYELERLVCNSCRAVYRASLPSEVTESVQTGQSSQTATHDSAVDPDAVVGPSRSTSHGSERTYDVSADVMVAAMRYNYGVPNYRLERILSAMGIPLSAGTQWGMIQRVSSVAMIIYRYLWYRSADSDEFLNDDTRMKVLAIVNAEKQAAPPVKNKDGTDRKSIQTSCLLARVDAHRIVLYATGYKNAGENLNDILALRDPSLGIPRQMCDGLAANIPADHKTEQANCNDHGRRKFNDQLKDHEKDVEYVLKLYGKIYHNDKQTRGMSDKDRLQYHQEHSTQVVNELEAWMTEVYDKSVEPNSKLGGAIKYMRKRWSKLTAFLRVEGAPLSNAECERKIKSIIPHRKGSLFYKNHIGAFVGDAIMSVMQTCEEAMRSPIHYFNTICGHRDSVAANPAAWLPWNYELNLV